MKLEDWVGDANDDEEKKKLGGGFDFDVNIDFLNVLV